MKILHTVLTRDLSGTERHAAELCTALSEQGHEVVLAIREDAEAFGKKFSIRDWVGKQVKVVEVPRRVPELWLLDVLIDFRPQIVHTHHGRDSRHLSLLIRLLKPLQWLGITLPKLVTTLHIGYSKKDHQHHHTVIALNSRQVQETRDRGFAANIVTIGNWVMPAPATGEEKLMQLRERFGLLPSHYIFGAVARLVPEKGLDVLIEAFRAASLPAHARLVILGDGVERNHLHSLAGEDLGTRIIMPGFRPDVRDFYTLFDCFVLPSRFEPFGLVLLEAMQAGCPIIATTTDGPKEIFEESSPTLSAAPESAENLEAENTKPRPVLLEAEDGMGLARALEDATRQGKTRLSWPMTSFHMESRVKEVEAVYRQLL